MDDVIILKTPYLKLYLSLIARKRRVWVFLLLSVLAVGPAIYSIYFFFVGFSNKRNYLFIYVIGAIYAIESYYLHKEKKICLSAVKGSRREEIPQIYSWLPSIYFSISSVPFLFLILSFVLRN